MEDTVGEIWICEQSLETEYVIKTLKGQQKAENVAFNLGTQTQKFP